MAGTPDAVAPIGWRADALRLGAIAVAYFVAARLSLLLEFQPEGIAAVWPPSGIFLSAVLLTRPRLRPALVAALAIADLLAERLSGTPWPISAAYAATLAADASFSAWLLLRVLGAPPSFGRVRDLVAFLLLSVLLSNGVTSLLAAEASLRLGAPSFWDAWLWWAASGGIGNLIVTPLLLSTLPEPRQGSRGAGRRVGELAALIVLLAAANVLVFARLAHSSHILLILPYTTFPFQIWAALRLGVRGVAAATVVIAAVTIGFALRGDVAGLLDTRLGVVIAVQLFLAVMAVPSFALASVVAERERAEEERDRGRDRIEEARRMEVVGRLSGGVAHDFNNMLTVILGRTNLALQAGGMGADLREDLLEIRDAARRSAELTSQLLAFARVQAVAPRVLDLDERVAGELKMLRRLIGEGIELAFRPSGGLWPVRIDPSQVDQILVNLCVNARDALGAQGRIWIETANTALDAGYAARHLGTAAGEHVMLSVCDDGPGMSKEVLQHVFEPFFTTKEPGSGTGLGLSTVYGIVKQNGGAIDVYSELGVGTTFKLYLPRAAGEPVEIVPPPAEPPRARGETIVLVEDDAAVRAIAKAMLERLGYGVVAVDGPDEAVRVAEDHPRELHLLLTDVVLPRMDGRDLAAVVRARRPGIRCLFMSGHSTSALAVVEAGVQFLQKPFSSEALAQKVREALDRA